MTHSDALRRLVAFGRGHWRMAAGQLALSVAGTLLSPVFRGVGRWFMDDLIPSDCADGLLQAGTLGVGRSRGVEAVF